MHPTSSTILPPFSARGGRKGANLRTTLEGLLGWVEWQWSILDGATQLDGGWLEDFFTYLIVGIKEEPGLGGDPFLQGLIAYNKIIAQEKVTFPPHVLAASLIRLQQYVPFLGRSNLQAVLLALSGNRLIISTAIFTDATYADKLLPITLCTGFHAPDKVLHIASVFVAINKCTERLRMLYKRLPEIAHSIPPARVLWPNPIVDPSRSTGLDHSLEIFPKVDHVLGTPFQTIDEVNKPRTMHLRRCRSQTISRPARFWSSSRQNTTKTLITCSPKTIPLSPQPSTPVHASSAICLWSSCNTSRSLRAGVCATPQYDQPWSSARGCFTGSPSTS